MQYRICSRSFVATERRKATLMKKSASDFRVTEFELIPVPEPPPLARSGQQTNQRVTFVLFSLRLRDFQS